MNFLTHLNIMQYENKPLHQIAVGDTIAYYQKEVADCDRKKHHREGLYSATVTEKIPYTLVLTTGKLKPASGYRVVISDSDLVSSTDSYDLPPREKGKTHKGVQIS